MQCWKCIRPQRENGGEKIINPAFVLYRAYSTGRALPSEDYSRTATVNNRARMCCGCCDKQQKLVRKIRDSIMLHRSTPPNTPELSQPSLDHARNVFEDIQRNVLRNIAANPKKVDRRR